MDGKKRGGDKGEDRGTKKQKDRRKGDGKELGPLRQDDSSKESRRKSGSGLRGTGNVFSPSTEPGAG